MVTLKQPRIFIMEKLTKAEAIRLLGGTTKTAAEIIGCSTQAVHKWPDILTPRIADRVVAAQVRMKKPRQRKAGAAQ